MQTLSNKNYDLVDVVKFFLALCVVAMHASLYHEHIYPFVLLAVPMFFLFSGYFSFLHIDAIQEKREKSKKFWIIIKRLMQLYLFWFVLELPYTLRIRRYFKNGVFYGVCLILQNFFFDSTYPGSWFIMATVLGTFIIYKLSLRCSNTTMLLITIPIYVLSTVFKEFHEEIMTVPILNTFCNTWERFLGEPYFNVLICVLYITLGKIIADNSEKLCSARNRTTNILLLLIGVASLVYESYFIKSVAYITLAPVAFLLVTLIFSLNFDIKNAKVFRKLSTVIYCSHIPTIAVVRKVLELLDITDNNNILTYVITLTVTISLGFSIFKLEKNKHFRFLKYSH